MKEFRFRLPGDDGHTHLGRRPSNSSHLVSVPCLEDRQDYAALRLVKDDDPRPLCGKCFPPLRPDLSRLRAAVASLDLVAEPIKTHETSNPYASRGKGGARAKPGPSPCGQHFETAQGRGRHRSSCSRCQALDGTQPPAPPPAPREGLKAPTPAPNPPADPIEDELSALQAIAPHLRRLTPAGRHWLKSRLEANT